MSEQPINQIGETIIRTLAGEELKVDGFCLIHRRLLTYPEYMIRTCFTCDPHAPKPKKKEQHEA